MLPGRMVGVASHPQRSRIRVSSPGGHPAPDSVAKFQESDPQHGQIVVALTGHTPLVAAPGAMLVGILAPNASHCVAPCRARLDLVIDIAMECYRENEYFVGVLFQEL